MIVTKKRFVKIPGAVTNAYVVKERIHDGDIDSILIRQANPSKAFLEVVNIVPTEMNVNCVFTIATVRLGFKQPDLFY